MVAGQAEKSRWGRVPELRTDSDHDAVLVSDARHVLVSAPPGTGKTCLSVRVAAKWAAQLSHGERVLLLTFSNQARSQLEREAALRLPGSLRNRVEITNYHRFFWQGVSAYRRALGLPMEIDIGSRARREVALNLGPDRARLGGTNGVVESIAEHRFPEFQDARTPAPDLLERLLLAVHREQIAGRLVFDDLGALFWSLLTRYPVVDRAYRDRYPVVIADEHQDASALQDAIARRLGDRRLTVFADDMQLIHEFRGASRTRLQRHAADCGQQLSLSTPHRWHGREPVARWLLAVRERLAGRDAACPKPPECDLRITPAQRGLNGAKPFIRAAVARAFTNGASSVAVLVRDNDRASEFQAYLCRESQYPRQIGTQDFEEARHDIEQLPLFQDRRAFAQHALDRVSALVPTLSAAVVDQVRRRITATGTNPRGAGPEAARLLGAFDSVFADGAGRFFNAVATALDACRASGHHLPRVEAARAIQRTADRLAGSPADLARALAEYSAAVLTLTHGAPRHGHGLFVMTAHQSKGKEFDAVVLADASARFWPDDDESRRLFYVVVTRATRFWTIIAPDLGGSPLLGFVR